jgi:hypothetical protein
MSVSSVLVPLLWKSMTVEIDYHSHSSNLGSFQKLLSSGYWSITTARDDEFPSRPYIPSSKEKETMKATLEAKPITCLSD